MVNKFQIERRKKYITEKKKCFKKQFQTKAEAKKDMRRINDDKSGSQKKKLQVIYFCYDCSCYHFSSQEKEFSRNFQK